MRCVALGDVLLASVVVQDSDHLSSQLVTDCYCHRHNHSWLEGYRQDAPSLMGIYSDQGVQGTGMEGEAWGGQGKLLG